MKQVVIKAPPFEPAKGTADNLSEYIQQIVNDQPNGKVTSIDALGFASEHLYHELFKKSLSLCTQLNQDPSLVKSNLILLLNETAQHIVACWGCILGGYNWLPWTFNKKNNNSEHTSKELQSIISQINNPVIICCDSTQEFINKYPELATYPNINIKDLLLDQLNPYLYNYSTTTQKIQKNGHCLIPTSGTTGKVKICVISHQTLLNRYARPLPRESNMRILVLSPLNTISALTLILPPSDSIIYFSPIRLATHPLDVFKVIEEYTVESIGLSSYMAALLTHAYKNSSSSFDLASCKYLNFGMDFIIEKQVKRLVNCLRHGNSRGITISYNYGLTECGPIWRSTFKGREIKQTLTEREVTNALSTGWELRIVNENQEVQNEGEQGFIEVRNKYKLFNGYLSNKTLLPSNDPNGWFRTGDIAKIHHQHLFISGREAYRAQFSTGNISTSDLENRLSSIKELYQSIIIVLAWRDQSMFNDELVILYVPINKSKQVLSSLQQKIRQQVQKHSGVRIHSLVNIEAGDVHRTSTGKIQRQKMLEDFNNKWKKRTSDHTNRLIRTHPPSDTPIADRTLFIKKLWKTILKINSYPQVDKNFFDLGGNSLEAAELISRLEKEFKIQLPLQHFYKNPTIKNIEHIISELEPNESTQPENKALDHNFDLIHRVESFVGSWKGDRLFPESLIVGRNTQGKLPPLFWTFQSFEEFDALSQHLGPNQPLYGMRSLIKIIEIKQYTTKHIELIVNRYLWEILALEPRQTFFLGGNCQAGIISLALAKALYRINKAPKRLILMEWSFNYGRYLNPTHFLYGEHSSTSNIYAGDNKYQINWRTDFPNHSVSQIKGKHGNFFGKETISILVDSIKQILSN